MRPLGELPPGPTVRGGATPAALRVLVAAASDATDDTLTALVRDVRDDDLVDAAAAHDMLGILHGRLGPLPDGAVPAPLAGRLAALHAGATRRGLRLEAALLRVLDVLAGAGVTGVPFKGPVLSERVYGEPGARTYADLDVLVAGHDLTAARAALVAVGWRHAGLTRPVDHGLLQMAECELVLEHPAGGVFLELHWRTGPRFARASFAAEPLIARAATLEVLGRSVPCLDDEDHFLVLCVHGASHCWDQLELVCTAAAFVRRGFVADWGNLLARARALGCARRVLVACRLAQVVAGVDLPAPAAATIGADPVVDRLVRRVGSWLRGGAGGLRHRAARILWQARVLDSPGDGLRHLVSRAFTPGTRDWDWVAVPAWLPGGYYALRPLRLLAQYAGKAVHGG